MHISPVADSMQLCGEHMEDLVQTCASVPLRNLEYLLLKKYDEKDYDILALDFMEV